MAKVSLDFQTGLDSVLFSMSDCLFEHEGPSKLPKQRSPTKPKLSRNLERDDLSQRYKLGKPGSKNYRKWESEFALRKSHSESTSSYSDGDAEFDESYEPAFGYFGQVFANGELDQKILTILDITEEEQRLYLNFDGRKPSLKQKQDSGNAVSCWKSLPRRNKNILKKFSDHILLTDIDNIIYEFVAFDNTLEVEVALNNSFQRLLLHSVCRFYNLVSYSINQNSSRVVIVKKRVDPYVSMSLSSFLCTNFPRKSYFDDGDDVDDFSEDLL